MITEEMRMLVELMGHYRRYDDEREERGLDRVMMPRIRELRLELQALERNARPMTQAEFVEQLLACENVTVMK